MPPGPATAWYAPNAAQVARITRHRTSRKTGKRTRETVYVITDRTSRQASPERIARLVRSQWVIENQLHFVRDVTFDEDRSQIRTGHGPENMATLRSLAINKLRLDGHTNTAAGLREMSYEPFTRPSTSSASPRDQQQHQDQTTLERPWYPRDAPCWIVDSGRFHPLSDQQPVYHDFSGMYVGCP
ncbi:ISAs1 family transposase [Streptomyces sp. NPDC050743]|uniref:ISAs1 family transposase n=1 Tax=Streptomyces sp. NPDC050743 TaxID=3365634 RepID=UPI0037943F68